MTSDSRKSDESHANGSMDSDNRFEVKLLALALALLLGAWLAVMLMTGSSWWGFDEQTIERRPTPDLTLQEGAQ